MEFVAYDYEEPGGDENIWHIYSLDHEPEGVELPATVITICGPLNEPMRKAVEAICLAIDAAIHQATVTSTTGDGNGH